MFTLYLMVRIWESSKQYCETLMAKYLMLLKVMHFLKDACINASILMIKKDGGHKQIKH